MIENRMDGAAPAADHTPRTVGNGTYVLIEFGGPELSYMLVRDEQSQKWHVNYTFFNERNQMVLALIGTQWTFWEAQDLASEDAQERWLNQQEQADEQVQDAKERDDPRYASQWDEYLRDGGPNNPDLR